MTIRAPNAQRSSRRRLAGAELLGFRRALDVADRTQESVWPSLGLAWRLGITDARLEALRSGKVAPRADAAVVRRLAEALVSGAGREPGTFAARFPDELAAECREAARSLGAEVYDAAVRDMPLRREWCASLAVAKRGPGAHLAPFLSAAGRPMLALVGLDGTLVGLVELTGAEGVECIGDGSGSDGRACFDIGHALTDGATARAVLAGLGRRLLPRGVHYAPWRPRGGARRGRCLVAVDLQARLVARMDLPQPTVADLVMARRDLEAVLETTPGGYRDGYEDSADDFGDEWKRDH